MERARPGRPVATLVPDHDEAATVLRHEDGWTANDPHGWVGDLGFEVGPVLYNPWATDPDVLTRLLPRRLDRLAEELDQPRDRLGASGFVAAVLSQVWSCEDGGAPHAGPAAVAVALRPG